MNKVPHIKTGLTIRINKIRAKSGPDDTAYPIRNENTFMASKETRNNNLIYR